MAVTKKTSGASAKSPTPNPKVAAAVRSDQTKVESVTTVISDEPETVVAPEAPAAPTTEKIDAAVKTEGTKMVDVIETTKKFTDQAKEKLSATFAEMSDKAKAGVEKSTKALSEFTEIAKGNVEAMVESGKIAAKGVETFGQDATEYGRASFEKASASMKNLAAVKSPAEFFQVQSEMLSSNFDSFAKEAAKSSEAALKLAGEIVQPISTRASIVTDKVKAIIA